MQELLQPAWDFFWREESPYVVSAALLLVALLWHLRPADRRSVGYTLALFALCMAGQFLAGMLDASGLKAGAAAALEIFVVGSGMAHRGIFVGQSSGAYIAVAHKIAAKHPGARIATVFPDTGERYFSTRLWD